MHDGVHDDFEARSLRYINEGLPDDTTAPSVNIPISLRNRADRIIALRNSPDRPADENLPGRFGITLIMRAGLERWVEAWEAELEINEAED
jgi:hypothetical protein